MGAPLPASEHHRRRDARLRIRKGIPAQVLTLDGQATASLLDLSASGAHLRGKVAFRRGQDLMLWWLGFEAFGRVVWVNGEEAGLEFHETLPQAVLLQTRQQVDTGVAPTTAEHAYDSAREWYLGHR